jgi:uncharacterized protein
MKCPADDTILQLAERQGIEIDYCPICRGVWLDRGELDKLIERSAALEAPVSARQPRDYDDDDDDDDDDRRRGRWEGGDDRRPYVDDRGHGRRPKKKRSSFLGDIFEFGE